ncbi:MAG: C/D box methylation guide ribonucleoprotein complex aNOP56 subunit [Candidatus Hadarchaeales archaeon]
MTVHIAECVLGVFAFDEAGNLLASRQFPRDAAQVAGRLLTVQMGTPTDEHRELVKELAERGEKELVLESRAIVEQMKKEFPTTQFKFQAPNIAGAILRRNLRGIARDVGFLEIDGLQRDVNVIITRLKLRREAAQRDKLIIQTITLLDEIDKAINILTGHLREWYSLHFPELNRLVPDHTAFLKLVEGLGQREKFTPAMVQNVAGVKEEEAKKICEAAQKSAGAALDETDMETIVSCVKEVLHLYETRVKLAGYIDGVMAQIAPNLKAVVGGAIGARLISLAGGLERLSKFPASTIQVLGAEKALFRSIKGRARPPKHGVIYQYPDIRGSPKAVRGKIARALAGKIAIAARIDAMAGEYAGDRLVAELKAKITKILQEKK